MGETGEVQNDTHENPRRDGQQFPHTRGTLLAGPGVVPRESDVALRALVGVVSSATLIAAQTRRGVEALVHRVLSRVRWLRPLARTRDGLCGIDGAGGARGTGDTEFSVRRIAALGTDDGKESEGQRNGDGLGADVQLERKTSARQLGQVALDEGRGGGGEVTRENGRLRHREEKRCGGDGRDVRAVETQDGARGLDEQRLHALDLGRGEEEGNGVAALPAH